MIPRRELVWVHDLEGTRVGAIGHGFFDIYTDDRLDQSETLVFEIAADHPKADLLVPDAILEHRFRRYTIGEIEQSRRGNVTTLQIEAYATWYRLGHAKYVGSFVLDDVTTKAGLTSILSGTGWTVGSITSTSTTTFSLEAQDRSRLEILRAWATITGRSIVFNTFSRTVDLVDDRGNARGLAFRYGRNITGVRRRIRPPELTRLFPYGADGLSIAGVNGGVPYLEDLSYYTDQGIDLDDPAPDGRTLRDWYTRSDVMSDTSFVKQADLLAAAEARLDEDGGPQVTYELDVVDLSEITSLNEETRVGDTVRVWDPDFGQDVRPTVTRYERHYLQPWRNRIELDTSPDPLSSSTASSSRPSTSQQWIQFVGPVRADYQIRDDGDYIVARIPLRFTAGGRADFHLDLWATGVGDGDMIVTIIDTQDEDAQQFKQLRIPYTDGETVRAFVSWATENLSGSHSYAVRVTTEADGGPGSDKGVDLVADVGSDDLDGVFESSWWIKAQGAVEETPVVPDSIRFDYVSDAAQSWTVPDNVEAITVKLVGAGSSGGGATVQFTIPTVPGTLFDVYAPSGPDGIAGGWPGGGDGGAVSGPSDGGGGGGYAALIPAGGSLIDAFGVAAGGGGVGATGPRSGGDGGFLNGADGESSPGSGASQSAGGLGIDTGNGSGEDGSFGQGGDGENGSSFDEGGGGGGGGWYGGGGGGTTGATGTGGGGGSGWISPLLEATEIELIDGGNSGNGYVEISWETPVDQ